MAVASCKWCGTALLELVWPDMGTVHYCRRCDTAPCTRPGSKLRAGSPKAFGADVNGWFVVPAEWRT